MLVLLEEWEKHARWWDLIVKKESEFYPAYGNNESAFPLGNQKHTLSSQKTFFQFWENPE